MDFASVYLVIEIWNGRANALATIPQVSIEHCREQVKILSGDDRPKKFLYCVETGFHNNNGDSSE